jgi:hypothetical protein
LDWAKAAVLKTRDKAADKMRRKVERILPPARVPQINGKFRGTEPSFCWINFEMRRSEEALVSGGNARKNLLLIRIRVPNQEPKHRKKILPGIG